MAITSQELEGGVQPPSDENGHPGYWAVRGSAGLADYAGTGLYRVAGPGAADALATATTRRVDFLLEGQVQQALVLRDDGSIVTDVLVHGQPEGYLIQVPAAAVVEALALIREAVDDCGASLQDFSQEQSLLGVEGPGSFRLIGGMLDFPISSLGFMSSAPGVWEDHPVQVIRAGVTGEYGYVVMIEAAHLERLRARLVEDGAVPVCADELAMCMMEMRFPHLVRELTTGHATPFELGLQWLVDFDNDCRGLSSLVAHESDQRPVCWEGATAQDGVPDPGESVMVGDVEIGTVRHAVWSPGLERVIGTASVREDCATTGVEVGIGGQVVRTLSAPFLVATSFGVPME